MNKLVGITVKTALSIVLSILWFLLYFTDASSQTAIESEQEKVRESVRIIDREAAEELETTEKPAKKKEDYSLKFGWWVTSYYWHFNNLDNDDLLEEWIRDLWIQDVRAWAMMELYQTLTTYFRIRYYHREQRVAARYSGEIEATYGPYIDLFYTKYDLNNRYNIPFEITLGRQSLTLGNGISLNDVYDGILIKSSIARDWTLKTFGSRTRPHDIGLDYSAPGYRKKHKRYFWGGELAYRGVPAHLFYIYSLIQRDRSKEEPVDELQNYHYNSEYYGLGVTGKPTGNSKYWLEIIKEYGHNYTDARIFPYSLKRSKINAWAYDMGGKYTFNVITNPTLEVEAAYGSGDEDRQRVTNTQKGNTGDDDKGFLYFGTFNAGYASMSRLSNMFIYKVGCSITPFEKCDYLNLNKVAVGAKYYFFHKEKKTGGIYDTDASQDKLLVGQEVDLYLYWRIYHNVFYTMRFGQFFPGSAYPDNADDRSEYFMARLTFLF